MNELPEMVRSLEAVRSGSQDKKPVEVTFGELVTGKWGISEDELFEKMGINPKVDTMQNIFTMPQQNIRWIVPEIIRAAITLGMRQAPFYPNIIASDQPINGLQAIMPMVNMSDAAPAKVNEAETIPLGDVSFGQKSVSLFKIGKGFKLTDEVRNYVSLDVLAIYLRDFGGQPVCRLLRCNRILLYLIHKDISSYKSHFDKVFAKITNNLVLNVCTSEGNQLFLLNIK
jgi:hypothetical protein